MFPPHLLLCWSRLSQSYNVTSVCFSHFPLCWTRLFSSYTATFVCFPTLPIMLVEVIQILHSVCFPALPIMMVEVIPILQSNICMLSNTAHYVGRGYPHLTQQPLYVSQNFPLCWSRLSPSYTANSVCFPTLPIMLVEVIAILHSNLCMFPDTSLYVGRGCRQLKEKYLYVFQHFPLCWSRLSTSYSGNSVCFPRLPIILVVVTPILQSNLCIFFFQALPIMLVEVILILQCNLCIFSNTSHYVGRGYLHLTQQPLYVSKQVLLCCSRLSLSYTATSLCFPTLPIMLVEVIPILQSNLCMLPNTSLYVSRGYPHHTKQPLYVFQH